MCMKLQLNNHTRDHIRDILKLVGKDNCIYVLSVLKGGSTSYYFKLYVLP